MVLSTLGPLRYHLLPKTLAEDSSMPSGKHAPVAWLPFLLICASQILADPPSAKNWTAFRGDALATGRAVSASAGEPYKKLLLPLPGFLIKGRSSHAQPGDVAAGFHLLGFFLEKHVFHPRGECLPEVRLRMTDLVSKHCVSNQ